MIFRLLKELSSNDIKVLRFSKNTTLFKQCDTIDNVYIVKEGIVKCCKQNFTFNISLPGDIIGLDIINLNSPNESYFYDAISLSNIDVYKISISEFKDLLKKNKDLRNYVISLLCNKILVHEEKIDVNQQHSIKNKIKYYLSVGMKYTDDTKVCIFSVKDLSHLSGLSANKVHQVLEELNDEKVIQYSYGEIKMPKT